MFFSRAGLFIIIIIIIIIIITDPQIAEVMNALVADENKYSATTGNNTIFMSCRNECLQGTEELKIDIRLIFNI